VCAMGMTVLFFSQQRLVRESLERALGNVPDLSFLPPVSETVQAIESVLKFKPEVILLDLNPSLFGIRVARELREACPECRILVLSSHADAIATTQLALAGVQGVLSKDIGLDDLVWAIREVGLGKTVVCENGNCVSKDGPAANGARSLTVREAQVLELVANGLANKQVAAELGISIKTVEKHRQRVMTKLHAHETAGLSWRAFCLGVARGSQFSAAH
jgi:DNA-binding NarL/FixJ family response regulator